MTAIVVEVETPTGDGVDDGGDGVDDGVLTTMALWTTTILWKQESRDNNNVGDGDEDKVMTIVVEVEVEAPTVATVLTMVAKVLTAAATVLTTVC
jgi:hypothetical protein